MSIHNLFDSLPDKPLPEEVFETLLTGEGFKLERIITTGQITPEGEWYDQAQDEWVLLLQGHATLVFEGGKEDKLKPGDYLFIKAHEKHRVSWTSPGEVCVWLAFHIEKQSSHQSKGVDLK